MKIRPVNDTACMGNKFCISPSESEKDKILLDRRLRELLPKFSENTADYAIIDTYRDKNGKFKISAVSFFSDETPRYLDIVD